MSRKAFLLVTIFLLLAGCSSKEPFPTGTADPTPTPVESAPPTTATQAWLDGLDLSLLPENGQEAMRSTDGSVISYLADLSAPQVTLYAVHFYEQENYELLLRQGSSLYSLGATWHEPLHLAEVAPYGEGGISLRWLVSQDELGHVAYDLDLLTPTEDKWSRCPITKGDCAQQVLDLLDLQWDDRANTLTLSYIGQTVTKAFPPSTAPGKLVLGDLCLFSQMDGHWEVVLSACCDLDGSELALFRAEVIPDGDTFQLQNIRMEVDPGV